MGGYSDEREFHGLTRADRARTLQELEGSDWGEPEIASHLAVTCHRLRRIPLREFTTEDTRIMIGQGIGLPYLVPLALGHLEENPLAGGDYYPGDLLHAVLRIDASFWQNRPNLRDAVEAVVRRGVPLPKNLEKELATFKTSGTSMPDVDGTE